MPLLLPSGNHRWFQPNHAGSAGVMHFAAEYHRAQTTKNGLPDRYVSLCGIVAPGHPVDSLRKCIQCEKRLALFLTKRR